MTEPTPEERAERARQLNEEFIRDHDDVHPIGKPKEPGEYGHPFHDRVAAYIRDNQGKLQQSFRQGYNSYHQDQAINYLRSMGIIDRNTPTARVNEFLAGLGIPPIEDHAPEVEADVTPPPLVSPDLDDEIVDAEIIEEDEP